MLNKAMTWEELLKEAKSLSAAELFRIVDGHNPDAYHNHVQCFKCVCKIELDSLREKLKERVK